MEVVVLSLEEMRFSPTAFLFEGGSRAGVGISMFIVRTPPGSAVELHVHPYPETFLLLEGHGRWTAGDEIVELEPNQMLVVPPDTAHGFRNTGDEPSLSSPSTRPGHSSRAGSAAIRRSNDTR